MATQPQKTGYAFAMYEGDMTVIRLVDTCTGQDHRDIPEVIMERTTRDDRVLLAIDAPLGWPEVAGRAFVNHRAGQPLAWSSDELFHRYTDDFVRQQIGKRPLEVGAGLIARTAHAALVLIDTIRCRTGREFEVITSSPSHWQDGVIEVYPAATAIAHSRALFASDKADSTDAIQILNDGLSFDASVWAATWQGNPHRRDACLSVLAAHDFLRGVSIAPPADHIEKARKEGWIWLRGTQTLPQESA